jgi:hypothetical protein
VANIDPQAIQCGCPRQPATVAGQPPAERQAYTHELQRNPELTATTWQ